MQVSCAVEGGYVPHSAAMLDSVIEHSGGLEVHVHYLHGPDFTAESERLLRRMLADRGAHVTFHELADERVAGLPTVGFTGKATWYRLFLPELLPDIDRVLHLDADLIAVDTLLPLWETDLGDHYLAAVTNVFMDHHLHRPAQLGLEGPETYFNAGVLLMNLAALRADGQSDEMLDYARQNADRLEWRDQDTLNVMLGHRRLHLHPRWNCMNAVLNFPQSVDVFGAAAVDEARRNPAIRHFEGPAQNKPWHYLSDPGTREAYLRHRARTPWPALRMEGRTPRNVLRSVRARLRP